MPELISYKLDTCDLSADGRKAFDAALAFAKADPDTEEHQIPIAVFCRAAGFQSNLDCVRLSKLMREVQRVSFEVESVDADDPLGDEGKWGVTLVFTMTRVSASHVQFVLARGIKRQVTKVAELAQHCVGKPPRRRSHASPTLTGIGGPRYAFTGGSTPAVHSETEVAFSPTESPGASRSR